jgi:HlyD family secretion protein
VVAINPQAEYVTRTALTEDERADLLFGVKVAITDPGGRFKPGLPVTVRLALQVSTTP